MSKHEKRLQRARNNPKNISYEDYTSILEKEGYTIREGKGSHKKALKQIGNELYQLIFVRPHGNKKTMHPQAIRDLLAQLDEIKALESEDKNDNE